MRQVTGQLSIEDALGEIKATQDYADRQTCPHCGLTYWAAPGNPYWTLARQAEEHREVEPGVCHDMAEVRDELDLYVTGRRVPSPWWSKQDLEIHILQLRDRYEHTWALYHSREGEV